MLFCFLFYLGFAFDLFVFDFTLLYNFEYLNIPIERQAALRLTFHSKSSEAAILRKFELCINHHVELQSILILSIPRVGNDLKK